VVAALPTRSATTTMHQLLPAANQVLLLAAHAEWVDIDLSIACFRRGRSDRPPASLLELAGAHVPGR